MWVRHKVPNFYDGAYFMKVTGIEFMRVKQGEGAGISFA